MGKWEVLLLRKERTLLFCRKLEVKVDLLSEIGDGMALEGKALAEEGKKRFPLIK